VPQDPRLSAHLDLAALPDREYVERIYRLVLRRDALPGDLDRCVAALERGALSRSTLIHELTSSEEFTQARALDDAVARAREARASGERPRDLRAPPRTDERAVEIAWVLSRYRGEPRVLDLGYAFAEPAYVAALLELRIPGLVAADLAEREVPGLRTVVADARQLPFEDGAFDLAFCISTLEHIGLDNRAYGLEADSDPTGQEEALRELARVLGPRGRLLVTVPCGAPADLGTFVQRDPASWLDLCEEVGFSVFEEEIYLLSAEGWRPVDEADVAGVRYGENGPGAGAVLCAELRGEGAGRIVHRAARLLRRKGRPERAARLARPKPARPNAQG